MKEILEILNNNGYEAFVVGGYVRDYLLNKSSFDVDICTNASIEDIIKIFNGKGKAYKEYMSYHIKQNCYNIEITSYRKEYEYINNKPTRLVHINDLYTDLLRRDFTINTICMDKDYNIIDLLGSKKDIDNKKIKVVGNVYDRFDEDNTRILRSIRFMCTLGFNLDNEIKEYIKEKGYLIKNLNKVYVKEELDKIFNSKYEMFFDIIEKYNLKEYFDIKYDKINFNSSYYGIWAQIENNFIFKREDKIIINNIKKLVSSGKIDIFDVYKYGELVVREASIILGVNIDKLLKELKIHSIMDIDITYNEVKSIVDINNVEKYYKRIEKLIVSNKLNNNKKEIIKYLEGEIK